MMRIMFRGVVASAVASAVVAVGGTATANAGSGWHPTGSMSTGRSAHGAALLLDGRVLVVSGFATTGEVPGADLYQPATGTWTAAAPPLVPRHYATATRLSDGRVLVAGGYTASGVTNHAELYDPVANTWTATGAMAEPRNGHAAVRLNDGRVLVTGGANGARDASATAEIYDPANGTWTPAGTMALGRQNHQAIRLADGRVHVAGGFASNPSLTFYAASEIYDPAANAWTPTAPMTTARAQMAGGLLSDGTVLAANGVNRTGFIQAAERFDPLTGTWSSAGSNGLQGNIAFGVTLRDGRFLMTLDGSQITPLYDPAAPASAAWSAAYSSGERRSIPSFTLLNDGRVLLAGGTGSGGVRRSTAELFTPPTERDSSGGGFPAIAPGDRHEQDVTLFNDGGNPLWIDGTGLAGDDADAFAVVDDRCTGETLEPTETCVVRVRFSPSAARTYDAELTVDDNAEASPPVALAGAGRVDPAPDGPPTPPADPPTPPGGSPTPPDPAIPVSCTRPYIALVGITATGGGRKPRAALTGLATPSLAGKTVDVLRGTRKVGSARIDANGRIAVSVPAPKKARARDIARYRLSIPGSVRSAALKATRRVASARQATLADGRVRVTGRVAGVRRPTTLQVRSAPVCGPKVRGVRVRTDRRGRFGVTVSAPPSGVPAVVHRVWLQNRSVTLPIVVTAKR